MSGYAGTNLFGPLEPVVRAQFAVMLHRLANEPDAAFDANIYGDVKNPEDFFATAVMWAREAKVITGYENGNFGPNGTHYMDPQGTASRAEVATMFMRYINYVEGLK